MAPAIKYFWIFVFGFALNWVWENLHYRLYIHYQNGEITNGILTRAALADGVFIVIIIFIAYQLPRYRSAFIILAGLALAAGIKLWALDTNRWAYAQNMFMVPVLNIGLSPFIQLALFMLKPRFLVMSEPFLSFTAWLTIPAIRVLWSLKLSERLGRTTAGAIHSSVLFHQLFISGPLGALLLFI